MLPKQKRLEELESAIYHNLEDLLFGMELTYDGIMDVLDRNFLPAERTGYTIPPGI